MASTPGGAVPESRPPSVLSRSRGRGGRVTPRPDPRGVGTHLHPFYYACARVRARHGLDSRRRRPRKQAPERTFAFEGEGWARDPPTRPSRGGDSPTPLLLRVRARARETWPRLPEAPSQKAGPRAYFRVRGGGVGA